jgi:hypothetical protein
MALNPVFSFDPSGHLPRDNNRKADRKFFRLFLARALQREGDGHVFFFVQFNEGCCHGGHFRYDLFNRVCLGITILPERTGGNKSLCFFMNDNGKLIFLDSYCFIIFHR